MTTNAFVAAPEYINLYIKQGGGLQLTHEIIENILYFSLLWNLFEARVCNKSASIPKIKNAILTLDNQGMLQNFNVHDELNYFVNRYIINGQPNQRFGYLNIAPRDEQLVIKVLTYQETAPWKVLFGLMIIVYRYRNNLFHGEKSLTDIYAQELNFEKANQLLMRLLDLQLGTSYSTGSR